MVAPEATISRNQPQVLTAVKNAIEENRLDLYLQPMVTLPQRKVRFYEAVTRLRDERDQIIAADDFIGVAEAAGLIGRIDHMVMAALCAGVAPADGPQQGSRALLQRFRRNARPPRHLRTMSGFSRSQSRAGALLRARIQAGDAAQSQRDRIRTSGRALAQRGFRFSIDHVTDLRFEPRDLADRGVRFIKVPATLLLDQRQASSSDIHPSDLSDLLGRFGIDLIAERIEGERSVVDLLDYDVRFGQGFLFAPPPAIAAGGAHLLPGEVALNNVQDSNGSGKALLVDIPAITSPRTIGTAALARRVAGPG